MNFYIAYDKQIHCIFNSWVNIKPFGLGKVISADNKGLVVYLTSLTQYDACK